MYHAKRMMRSLLRFTATRVRVAVYERLMAHSVLKERFNSLRSIRIFDTRDGLWDHCISEIGASQKITYVEFGVHTGVSIRYFAQHNTNKDSIFIGLDSFEGLPEDWGVLKKGEFDVKGAIPETDDTRIAFIKGWFQNTWNQLSPMLATADVLIVHYDADLYSSTLFSLSQIDSVKQPYTAIFDEFTGHEARALYNYLHAFNASVSFLGQVIVADYPIHVLCKITPNQSTS